MLNELAICFVSYFDYILEKWTAFNRWKAAQLIYSTTAVLNYTIYLGDNCAVQIAVYARKYFHYIVKSDFVFFLLLDHIGRTSDSIY